MLRGLLSVVSRGTVLENVTAVNSNSIIKRNICNTTPLWKKKMPDRPAPIDEADFTEVFLHGSGPGGQKIESLPNKTSSAVQLKHIPTGMVLKVQATRSRTQNRKIARQMLAERLELLEKGKESRVAIVGETKKKRKSSAVKKSKRKYRLLAEEKAMKTGEDKVEVEEEEEEEGGLRIAKES
ncbi:hypothetical protein BOTCAL_0337g00060 [Botryotinia calthae]|uniref:Prokaryotic-type class I peptide chain release factors domain-containing protein n=1 Tax=Botryotinia calthae TaxID=38488 RepID=A0A4Y8CVQ1_9HELO|nr:hypothetical protein BOTCAL_0337g00060 [Botryotinia calthae]